jgi:dTMP kinase
MSQRGTYVVLEGIDGTGKTELAGRLVPALVGRGHSVSSFHDPTDGFLRDQYRRLSSIDPLAAALCLTVDRALLRSDVERALDHGDVVLQDQSYYSTLAYQSPALGLEAWRELERIQRALVVEPDVILYLDAPVDLAISRIESRGRRESFEDGPYLAKVKGKFEQMFQPPKWVRIDATGSPDRTAERALTALTATGL